MLSCGCNCLSLKIRCFIIGYINLLACVLDIGFYVIVAAIVSNGFQCDVDERALQTLNWWWLEPTLTVVNLGTHGFYPLPVTMPTSTPHTEYVPVPKYPKCYPGFLHIYLFDVLNLLINIIWLKFVFSYVKALHKKDAVTMRLFFHVSVVKVILQVMYYAYQPTLQDNSAGKTHWLLKLADIGLSTAYLFAIKDYATQLSGTKVADEKSQFGTTQPPSYIECLMAPEIHRTRHAHNNLRVNIKGQTTDIIKQENIIPYSVQDIHLQQILPPSNALQDRTVTVSVPSSYVVKKKPVL